MQKEVYVYRRINHTGKLKLIQKFDSITQLVSVTRNVADVFGYTTEDRHTNCLAGWDPEGVTEWMSWDNPRRYCYVAYENDVTLITPDRLVGAQRSYNNTRKSRYIYYNSWRKRGWRKGRGVRTTQERKYSEDWDDDGNRIRVRAKRNAANIPDCWDDYRCITDRSWKTQSKRRKQWKGK